MPDLSVVVPTRSRAERLRRLLEALAREDVEVIVVADGPTAAVEDVLFALDARVIRHARSRGPAAARNAGWRAASAPLVAFVDDDCLVAPGWAGAMLARARAAPGAVVQGRVEPHPDERERIGPFSRTLWVRDAGPFFPTANILYPRELLERLRGFDEAYPFPAGEDTDLGWRAREAGAEAVFAPDALVWHAVHDMGPAALIRDAPRWGSAVRLVARHPGLRSAFHHRFFWKRSHERLLVALAGLLLAPRTRGLSLLLVLPWLEVHRTEHPSIESLAASLPAHLAVDAAEVAALARGSLEARTVML